MRNIARTVQLGLVYKRQLDFGLVAFSDADWASDPTN